VALLETQLPNRFLIAETWTEADGSRISLRTHQSRHWRNTLYKLGGMTEIQQALAMGRKDASK
jgi:hypothetical protein